MYKLVVGVDGMNPSGLSGYEGSVSSVDADSFFFAAVRVFLEPPASEC